MMRLDSKNAKDRKYSARAILLFGYASLVLFLFGFVAWSNMTVIASAVIAHGTLQLPNRSHVVQHESGGVVKGIFARNGDIVSAGDVVLSFDDEEIRNQSALVETQLKTALAVGSRLVSERDGISSVSFPTHGGQEMFRDSEMIQIIASQERLLGASFAADQVEYLLLDEDVAQIEIIVQGVNAQIGSLETQHKIAQENLNRLETLFLRKVANELQVNNARKEISILEGQLGALISKRAQHRSEIARINIQRSKLVRKRREMAILALRENDMHISNLLTQWQNLQRAIELLSVRAPISGEIHGSTVFTLHSVVKPAAQIMLVVPVGQEFIVSAQVEVNDISEIFVGQDVRIKLSSFQDRNLPDRNGVVVNISADTFERSGTSQGFYTAEIRITDIDDVRPWSNRVRSGMQAEVFFKTGEKSPFAYLTDPLTAFFSHAFKEK